MSFYLIKYGINLHNDPRSTVNDVSFWSINVHPQPPSTVLESTPYRRPFPSTPLYPALLKYYYRLVHIYIHVQSDMGYI